jgi:hypothetical protein
MNWRVVIAGDGGRCYLVHVPGESEQEARRAAKLEVARDLHDSELRVRSAERITI